MRRDRCGLVISFADPPEMNLGFSGVTVTHGISEHYDGPYEATPTQETQVISTQHMVMDEDFIVNPIPQNYGLITYNGFELTVS